MSSCVFRRRLTLKEEKQIIVEEITYLLNSGYRPEESLQITAGMLVALDGCSDHEWRLWADLPMQCVMDDFLVYGVP